MLFILSTLLGVFSVNGDTASISFGSIWQQDTIRIQFSLGEHNYTTSAHHIFKLKKDRDGFKTAYYFSKNMEDSARLKKNIHFSKNDIKYLTECIIEIEKEEHSKEWICFPTDVSCIFISYQNKKYSLTTFDKENIENIKVMLLGKIYFSLFSSSLLRLKTYWK